MLMCLHAPITQLVGQLWGRLNPEEKQGWVQRAIRARSARATATATAAASGQPVRRHHSPLISLSVEGSKSVPAPCGGRRRRCCHPACAPLLLCSAGFTIGRLVPRVG